MTVEEYRRFLELVNHWQARVTAERLRGVDAKQPPATRGYAYGLGDGLETAAGELSALLDEMAREAMTQTQPAARHH